MRRYLLCVLAAIGCSQADGDADADLGDTETDGEMPVESPVFIDPANDALTLPTTRADDVSLRVAGISEGLTALVVDGLNFGSLRKPRAFGVLDTETLLLFIGGALVESRHTMQLQTPAGEEVLTSSEVVVEIVAGDTIELESVLSSSVAWEADRIISWGQGSAGTLITLQDDSSSARLARAAGVGWNTEQIVEVPLPQLASVSSHEPPPVAAAIDRVDVQLEDDDRLRVVWRSDDDRIFFIDEPWGSPAHNPNVALELAALIDEPVEQASLGRPVLAGDSIITEVFATRDVEAPKPGDHALATVALSGSPAQPGPARLSSVAGTVDVDRIGPVLDLTGAVGTSPYLLSLRLDLATSGLLEVGRDDGALVLARGSGEALQRGQAGWEDATSPLASMRGAFGSRIVFGYVGGGGEPAVKIQRLDDWGTTEPQTSSVPATSLPAVPAAAATASAAVGIIAGVPIMVIPMGSDEPSVAILAHAAAPTLRALEPLRCDQVALPATDAGNAEGRLQIACLREGMLFFGTIRVAD